MSDYAQLLEELRGAYAYVEELEGLPGEKKGMVPRQRREMPMVTGSGVVGTALNCSKGVWIGKPTDFDYQWSGNGRDVKDATKASYTVTEADVGHMMMCVVTAKNDAGETQVRSNMVEAVGAPVKAEAPRPQAQAEERPRAR